MDAVREGVEPRKRGVWKPVLIILLILACFAGFVAYKALQPKYSFLRGLEPVFQGDPQRISASSGIPTTLPPMFVEVYSVQGSYDDWQKVVEPEMLSKGAEKQLPMEVQLRKELKGQPAEVVEQAIMMLKDFPVSNSWEFGKKSSLNRPNRGVQILKDVRFRTGQEMAMLVIPPKAPGWVTIAVYEPQKPTFISKISDWMRSVFTRP